MIYHNYIILVLGIISHILIARYFYLRLPKKIEEQKNLKIRELIYNAFHDKNYIFSESELDKLESNINFGIKNFNSNMNKIMQDELWQTLALTSSWGSGKTVKIKYWISKNPKNKIFINDWILSKDKKYIYNLLDAISEEMDEDIKKEIKEFLYNLFVKDSNYNIPKSILLKETKNLIYSISEKLKENFIIVIDEIDRSNIEHTMSLIDEMQIMFDTDNFILYKNLERPNFKFRIIYVFDKKTMDSKIWNSKFALKENTNNFYNKYFHKIEKIYQNNTFNGWLEEISYKLNIEETYWTGFDILSEKLLFAKVAIDKRKIYQNLIPWEKYLIKMPKELSLFKAFIIINHVLKARNISDVTELNYSNREEDIDIVWRAYFKDDKIIDIINSSASSYSSGNNDIPNMFFETLFYPLHERSKSAICKRLERMHMKYIDRKATNKEISLKSSLAPSNYSEIEEDLMPKLLKYSTCGSKGGSAIKLELDNYN